MKVEIATYEAIGKYAVDYYVAEGERVNARIQRAIAREGHKCAVEKEYNEEDTGAGEEFCWRKLDVS